MSVTLAGGAVYSINGGFAKKEWERVASCSQPVTGPELVQYWRSAQ